MATQMNAYQRAKFERLAVKYGVALPEGISIEEAQQLLLGESPELRQNAAAAQRERRNGSWAKGGPGFDAQPQEIN
jgi:hypothetical protein